MLRHCHAHKMGIARLPALGLALRADPAPAQLKFFPDQCAAALAIAEQVIQRHDISPRLLASFENFRRSNCDVETTFAQDTKADVMAFAEFKLKFEMWRTCTDNPVAPICQSETRNQLEQK